ncbi:MAG TPA: ABC transporter substrate-binding protein, partial [bacterium]|nr:ABC transporter substrate-binding protein [bacterium]
MKRWGVLVGAVMLTLALVAPAPSQGQVKLTSGKIVIAVLNDMSGVYKDLSGPNSVEAVRMAVADFEQQFGKFPGPVEILSADHQNKPDLA